MLDALWSADPVEHRGRFWTICPGTFQPKPAQQPPPLHSTSTTDEVLDLARRFRAAVPTT